MIAKRLIPPELTHQNDVSCYVAEKWRCMSASERGHFFKMAEEHKKRLEAEPAIERKQKMDGRRQPSMPQGANVLPMHQYIFPAAATATNLYGTGRPGPVGSISASILQMCSSVL